jgi:hypothetical protein
MGDSVPAKQPVLGLVLAMDRSDFISHFTVITPESAPSFILVHIGVN